MLKLESPAQPPAFQKKLKKLFSNFSLHRQKISGFPFTKLPWEDFSAFKSLNIARKYEHICVVGIGGSSLGVKAIAGATKNESLCFLDNIDPDFAKNQLKRLNAKKTLFLLTSKSGETIEITSLATILLSKFNNKNFFAITDNPKSTLGKLAHERKIPIIQSKKGIPGRFSVLSINGLLPASLAKINADKILKGAKNTSSRDAFFLACNQYLHFLEKKNITVLFSYSEQLGSLMDWYVQLLSESLGKTKKVGITPIKAIGVKDQHSQLQLFLDGPDDKFFLLIKPENSRCDFDIPGKKYSLGKLFNAEYMGVKKALIERKKPLIEISFPKITPEIIGELFFLFELQIAYLGELLKINIDNQPAVELSKKLTREGLAVCKR